MGSNSTGEHAVFILSTDGRDADVDGQFKRYRDYLDTSKPLFPAMAFALATSDWYYGCHNHRGPHDARLEGAVVSEKDFVSAKGKGTFPSRSDCLVRITTGASSCSIRRSILTSSMYGTPRSAITIGDMTN